MLITPMPIILASASPRRRELLTQLRVKFEVMCADIDETYRGEEAKTFAMRLARQKADNIWQEMVKRDDQRLVLAADTIVVLNGEVMGKPESFAHYMGMMNKLSGQTHQVYTAVSVIHEKFSKDICIQSDVTFKDIRADEAERYWETTEPADKAGGYGIQGLGAIFVRNIVGSYTNIVGLPLFEVHQLLTEAERVIF